MVTIYKACLAECLANEEHAGPEWQSDLTDAHWCGPQGGASALVAVVRQAGPALITRLPQLWERMSGPLLESSDGPDAPALPPQSAADAQVCQKTILSFPGCVN